MNYNQTTNVLIIDDDAVNNFIAETLIKKAAKDAEITICLNGQEAIEQLLSIKQSAGKLPRFIFLDIAMPVMDGWRFLDEYRRLNLGDGSNSEIIMVSSSRFRHDIDRALGNAIVKEYVKKPLSMELVKRILRVDHHDNW
jgi:CheY-like chemotaxis protein